MYEYTNIKPQEYISKKLKIERKKKRDAVKDLPFLVKVLINFV